MQLPPLRDCSSRVIQIIGGERGGKSYIGSLEATAWSHGFTDLIWFVGPDYEQARPEFENVTTWLQLNGVLRDGNISFPKEGKCIAETDTSCVIETKTSEEVRKLASKAPGLVVMCEAGQQGYDTFLKLRGRVAEKRGLLMMTGTLEEGATWYSDLYRAFQLDNAFNARSYSVPSWANLGVYPGGENDPEIVALRNVLPKDLFLERHAAIPRKPSYIVFPEFTHLAHVSEALDYVPELPVFLAIDPGFAGAYAVLACHILGGKCWAFDEIYAVRPDRGTDSIVDACRRHDWWPKVERIVIDVAARAANLTDGKSVSSMWQEATMRDKIGGERGLYPVGQSVGILDGIDRYRRFLGNPDKPDSVRLGYHPRCINAIGEHALYRYPKRRTNIIRSETERPVDAHNHAIKAMTYLIVDRYGYMDGEPPATAVRMYSQYARHDQEEEVELPPEFVNG